MEENRNTSELREIEEKELLKHLVKTLSFRKVKHKGKPDYYQLKITNEANYDIEIIYSSKSFKLVQESDIIHLGFMNINKLMALMTSLK